MKPIIIAIFSVVLIYSQTSAQIPEHKEKKLMFGNLHAHGELSLDISKRKRRKLGADKAFQYAMDNGLNFLAITEHHKATDSPGKSLRIEPEDYEEKLLKVASKFSQDNRGRFVAIAGIEWGNTKTSNHINLFGLRELPPDNIKDEDYDKLIAWATENAEFIQFNHPNSKKGKKKFGNYGEKLFEGDAEFVNAADDIVKTISLITTVRGGHISGQHKNSDKKTHRHGQWENYYQEFLNRGFHISPSANQDTHGSNWGTVTAARTAVWTDDVDFNGLMSGFKSNRVYATEDDEMAVVFLAKYDGEEFWMGDQVTLNDELSDVEFEIKIWQAKGSDGDSVNEGPYEVIFMSDVNGKGGEIAKEWKRFTLEDRESKAIRLNVKKGSYIYLKVIENNGKDNQIGDFDNDRDGFRDNLNDKAWTSPIWFN